MSLRPYWHYYKNCFPFIFGFGFFFVLAFGWIIGAFIFCTIAVWIGHLAVAVYKSDQYYFFYNMGITKAKLLKQNFLINLFVAIPVTLIFFLISQLIGNPSVT